VLEKTNEQNGLDGEDIEFRRADGSTFVGRVTDTVVQGEDGEVSHYDGVVADVTEQKRREQELREGRQKLREEKKWIQAITEDVSDGIYRSAAEEGIVYANQAFIEMFGYRDLEELKAAESKALYADLAQRETLIEKETEEGRLDREEVQFRRKDGTTFVGLLSSQQVEGEDQEKVYFDGAVTDITERKRHEERLERRQRNIEALYETTRSLLRAESREAVCDRMELEVAETLFEPFRQASEGLDRDYEGTGIGLAVVKRAVEQMDGTVDVKTQKGEGSRFTVRFPRAGKGGKSR